MKTNKSKQPFMERKKRPTSMTVTVKLSLRSDIPEHVKLIKIFDEIPAMKRAKWVAQMLTGSATNLPQATIKSDRIDPEDQSIAVNLLF